MSRFLIITILGLSLLPISTPADADVKNGAKTIECYCTDRQGDRVELGQMICLQVDGRMFTARCEMSLNNPMWREVTDGCLSSQLPTDALRRLHRLQPTGDPAPIYPKI